MPRLVKPDEYDAATDLASVVFGMGPVSPPWLRRYLEEVGEVDRTFAVFDGDGGGHTVVGTAAAFSFGLMMPGGGEVPMAGLTMVGARPTHRRRGILRRLLDAIVDQALEREEAVVGLTASEATIYRRFGYGVAVRRHSLAIDRAGARDEVIAPPGTGHRAAGPADPAGPGPAGAVPPAGGRFRMLSEDEAATVLPVVWDRHLRRVPGEIRRTPGFWRAAALDVEEERRGASPRYLVAHEGEDGSPDGYAVYRLEIDPPDGNDKLHVVEVAAADDAVEAALVRYLLDVDLPATIVWPGAPVDLPLRWRLADDRAVQVTGEADHLWLRLLDVARCLAERRYATAGGLVVEVVDESRLELGGRFRLDAGPGGADCERTHAEPDVVLAMPELGSLLLGGVSWSTLGRAGTVVEATPGALVRADTLFHPSRAPFSATDF